LVNPYDISATAQAMHDALSMPDEERAERNRRLAAAATALTPQQWFVDQLTALGG
jgi:trehalose 6-phosphate synthase